ncbi:hypothetical protein MTP99_013371 [Tenebrio molitor]|jgi:hypothetical protein|nr:hypothetical protein MTP99_013371 [Tenebrio molitor]
MAGTCPPVAHRPGTLRAVCVSESHDGRESQFVVERELVRSAQHVTDNPVDGHHGDPPPTPGDGVVHVCVVRMRTPLQQDEAQGRRQGQGAGPPPPRQRLRVGQQGKE